MHLRSIVTLFALSCSAAYAQQNVTKSAATAPNSNIYEIKKQFLLHELHNPTEQEEDGEDNDLARFNRWFNRMEDRTYPSGNLPRPDVLLKAAEQVRMAAKPGRKTTAGASPWHLVGPQRIPANFNGIGRVNCIVLAPQDTSTIFIGTACGGVWSSHDGGSSWFSATDNFPSLSIADIAINPKHMDTIYAATGDGYGYENGGYNIFWGGLYSAGVMRSTDTGHTWAPTGLSYLQYNNDMIQRLLIHPRNTNILMAATRNGLMRSTDAGATWTNAAAGHIFSMAFHPTDADTVYAVDSVNLIVSYNAGATWTVRYAGINASADRCTIGVSPASPNSIWVLNNAEQVLRSYNYGFSFAATTTSPAATASFYGYYDRVLAISPVDSNLIYAFGKNMARSTNNGVTWSVLDNTHKVHVDFHAATINPLRPQTIYCGNDGGISVSYNGGGSWRNLGDGLVISQVYRVSASRQDPSIMLAGLQDNGTFANDGSAWWEVTGGDGMDNAISPVNDY
ncbi:MAG: hypothetical protein H7257_09770, partial [Taibaiella sp.]|nr:hypothetical protein [Taibaiella sp.]